MGPKTLQCCTHLARPETRRNAVKQIFSNLMKDESGQDLIEYALVSAFIALGAVTMLKSVSGKITTVFTSIGTTLTSAV
jgi:pilus assembly protein Flp/PilA